MFEKKIFYDTDCLSCFLAVNEYEILQKLFSKIIIPKAVEIEILDDGTPKHIKNNFYKLVKQDFVEVQTMEIGSPEYELFNEIKKNHDFMGDGEAAVIALTHENGGVIASNNLNDVKKLVKDFNLNLITTAFILAIAYEKGIKTRAELDGIWKQMIKKGRKRSLPTNIHSFTQYYNELYFKDTLDMGLD